MKARTATAIAATMCSLAGSAVRAGPDVLGGSLNGSRHFASVGGIAAYAFGVDMCNVGSARLQHEPNNPLHPATAENLYRLHQGRFEQIGMGWMFHHFCALQQSICATCDPAPACDELGVGCSTSSTAAILGSQLSLAPRSQANPATGVFPFPFTAPALSGPLSRRVQVTESDLDPVQNPGALYFAETVYLARDDSTAGNAPNNASYRRVTVSGPAGGPYNLAVTGTTSPGAPAILAWAAADPGVGINAVGVPGDGRFYVASKATQVSCSRYRYDYAVFNLNSDRSAGSFSVPFAVPQTAAAVGFHDIAHHSGETISGTDWTPLAGGCEFSWTTEDFAANPNANAIRWGTLYNFSFETHWAPVNADASIGLFKPGVLMSVDAGISAPSATPAFAGDYDGDAAVGLGDIALVINQWTNPCGSPFGLSSIADVVNNWGNACP